MSENDQTPATKTDIADLAHLIERVETKLLTAFHQWAQTYEVRARGTSAAVRDFDERLGLLEERVNRIERGGHA